MISPKVEDERMVMDLPLQDVSATIEDQMAQSNSRLFGTSSQVPTADPKDNEENMIPVTISRISTTLMMMLMTDF